MDRDQPGYRAIMRARKANECLGASHEALRLKGIYTGGETVPLAVHDHRGSPFYPLLKKTPRNPKSAALAPTLS